jgi:replicative DNA helicase Mcm
MTSITTELSEEPILSVSDALRIIPNTERGETDHTGIRKVRGMISSMRPVIKMISGVYGECEKCKNEPGYKPEYLRLDKPEFSEPYVHMTCKNTESDKHEVQHSKKGEIEYDESGCMIRKEPWLDTWAEYRNATIIELQDQEKFDDLERLQVILFDDDTRDVRAGEQVLVTGEIYFERFSKMDSKINSRLYSHSITYEARREISLSSMDVAAIKRFVSKYGDDTIDELVKLFAPKVVGFNNIKKGLLLCAASCCNDSKKVRVRMHSLLVGEPGQAKSTLAREITGIVPNSRFESAQNSSGKSLTAIVSKEGRESSTVLRLGPIPFAKEAICGLNELGRMSFNDQAPLLDVMEEGEFTINKYGMNALIRSPTVIVGSANPTGSKWSSLGSDGRINLDDIPAIKPLLDRFDYMFVIRTSRDENVIREYANARAKYEDTPVPGYNVYLEKHLIYAKRFNPKMSTEATTMLIEYYTGIAKIAGSPRVRDTLYKTAKMIARLKLKNIVDAADAKEACQFYNVILNEYDHIVNIPANPIETAIEECLYTIEAAQAPILFEEAVLQTCKRNDYVATYIGNEHRTRINKRLRQILERLLENSHIKRIQMKPTVLQWIKDDRHSESKSTSDHGSSDSKKNTEESSIDVPNVPNVPKAHAHTKDKKPQSGSHAKSSKDKNNDDSDNVPRAHMAHMAHSTGSKAQISKQTEPDHISYTSYTSYGKEESSDYYKFMDTKTSSWEMGFDKKFVIARIYEHGDRWICKHSAACSKLSSDKHGIWAHALNHGMAEIKEKLGVLEGYSHDMQKQELKRFNIEQLDVLLAQVEPGSQLQKQILLAKDFLMDGGRI